ncbi:MAG: hypothetical protein N4A37_00885, partial [Prolixibacteraceae bacterium]|nr:hypothetical protein [Prolixibacteraceae bacterium]
MVTKDIDQENSLKGNVQEKLKGVDYELPIIRETPDPLKRWRLNLVQADEEKLILDYIGASYSMYLGSMLMFGGGIIIFLAFDDIIDMFKFIIREHSFTLDHLFLSCICFSFFILGFIPVFIQLIG